MAKRCSQGHLVVGANRYILRKNGRTYERCVKCRDALSERWSQFKKERRGVAHG